MVHILVWKAIELFSKPTNTKIASFGLGSKTSVALDMRWLNRIVTKCSKLCYIALSSLNDAVKELDVDTVPWPGIVVVSGSLWKFQEWQIREQNVHSWNTMYWSDSSSVTTANHNSLKGITELKRQHGNKYREDIICYLETELKSWWWHGQ